MQSFALFCAASGALLQAANAAPAPAPVPTAAPSLSNAELEERGLLGSVLSGLLGGVVSELNSIDPSQTGTAGYKTALSALTSVTPVASPTAVKQAISSLSAVFEASPTPSNLYAAVAEMVGAGLVTDNIESTLSYVNGALTGEDSVANSNTRSPSSKIYPKASSSDAPYDLTEAQLRAAIYIPSTFKYGAGAQPIILVPGTGDTGYTTFKGNYIPLLQGSSIGDPVWLNIPGFLLNDAQKNAEYVAYAINYIYGISKSKKVAVFAWSQGNINAQWAYKYWPSTRSKVTDHIGFSADYHGTVEANFIALGEPLPPAVLQQEYNSNFITTLRKSNGDSAYVPSTIIYSGLGDEVVEPQQGTGASAYLNDVRKVGVSNNEVQTICAGQPAGGFVTHEGTLYNALGYALAVDALSRSGPGKPSNLNLNTVCANYITPGLDLADFLETENAIAIAGTAILVYPNKVVNEPAISSYAKSS